MTKLFNYMVTGLGFGFTCTIIGLVWNVGFNEITTQLVVWYVASLLYGVSAMIYEIESMSLFKQTIVHYIICLSITLVVLFMLYRDYMFSALIIFTIAYIAIYIKMWMINRYDASKINDALNKRV